MATLKMTAYNKTPLKTFTAIAIGILAASALPAPLHAGDAPIIDHQPVPCSLPAKHTRICAIIADDGEIKKAKVYFRARGESAFYWSEMRLDFRNFCATLPLPEPSVPVVDYHIWAIDDELQTRRTTDFEISVAADQSCPYPVLDEDPERTSRLVVYATTRKQGKKLRHFLAEGVEFHRVKKK